MPEINSFRFLLRSNNYTDMGRYALFGIENEDVQLALTCFLDNRMIYRKIIGDEGYYFIPLNPSIAVVCVMQIYSIYYYE